MNGDSMLSKWEAIANRLLPERQVGSVANEESGELQCFQSAPGDASPGANTAADSLSLILMRQKILFEHRLRRGHRRIENND